MGKTGAPDDSRKIHYVLPGHLTGTDKPGASPWCFHHSEAPGPDQSAYGRIAALHRVDRVLLRQILDVLGGQLAHGLTQHQAGLGGLDHGIDVATFGGDVGAGHVLVVEVHEDLLHVRTLGGVLDGLQLLALDHHHCGCGTHDGDLCGRPGEVEVTGEVLGPHDRVGATVGLADDQGDLRDGRLHHGEGQFGPTVDESGAFLFHTGQVTRGVHDEDDGDVVGVADADEPGTLVGGVGDKGDRKSTRLNSSHVSISYAVFCLKEKSVQLAAAARPARPGGGGLPDTDEAE